jgi:hypothetical protein
MDFLTLTANSAVGETLAGVVRPREPDMNRQTDPFGLPYNHCGPFPADRN